MAWCYSLWFCCPSKRSYHYPRHLEHGELLTFNRPQTCQWRAVQWRGQAKIVDLTNHDILRNKNNVCFIIQLVCLFCFVIYLGSSELSMSPEYGSQTAHEESIVYSKTTFSSGCYMQWRNGLLLNNSTEAESIFLKHSWTQKRLFPTKELRTCFHCKENKKIVLVCLT